ncbi:MAG TPA: IclR family transcriptional regulator, partial [Usitatibacteraceae bacterium]|nr:IclR family transcriptional regulator [Usitatibacteraceae bacterium]
AQAALMNGPARAERHAILSALVAEIGETCNLAALAGTDIVYLDRVETSWPLRMLLAPGSHVPLHASASGKLLLALLPRPQRTRLLESLTLRGYTENTLVDRAALEQDLEATRARRIGINRAEHLQGMYGIAVPVMQDSRRACAAVALQAPAGRATIEALMVHVPRLEAAAARIARTFAR